MPRTIGIPANSDLETARRLTRAFWAYPYAALFRAIEGSVFNAFLDQIELESPVLDVGCGNGLFARELFGGRGVRLIGFDLGWKVLPRARRLNLYSVLFQADASRIPLASASVPLAFSNSSVEHMPPLGEVLAEVQRVLQPGGMFIFTVPTDRFGDYLLGTALLERMGLRDTARRYARRRNAAKAHVNLLAPQAWEQRLAAAGFRKTWWSTYLTRKTLMVWDCLDLGNMGWGRWNVGNALNQVGGRLERRGIPLPQLVGNSAWRFLAPLIRRDLSSPEPGAVALLAALK